MPALRLPNRSWWARLLTASARLAVAEAIAVPTQQIGHKRKRRKLATFNGLMASVPPERQARIKAKLEAARGGAK